MSRPSPAPADARAPEPARALEKSFRLIHLGAALAFVLPAVTIATNMLVWRPEAVAWPAWAALAVFAIASGGVALWIRRPLGRLRSLIEQLGAGQASLLDKLPVKFVPAAIAASAGLSLLLELAVIRWQGTVWETFAFYKNFGLLACFLGLGIGYATAGRQVIAAGLTLPLLAFQVAYLISLRHLIPSHYLLTLHVTPIPEQLTMGVRSAEPSDYVGIVLFLAVVVLLTALAFVPVGQVCGRLLRQAPQLAGYGWNLAGSIGGVVILFGLSFLWTPPMLWFAPCVLGLIAIQLFDRRAVALAAAAATVMVLALAWPVALGWERVYSPYQLLEWGTGGHGPPILRAAGQYYQRVHDLSPAGIAAHPDRAWLARYYEFPYEVRPNPGRVAVVGAGTGNDVAAALRRGAERVDAIEIDPAILAMGVRHHPEAPYHDPRVRRIVADARSFLRDAGNRYDLIVYGLLDSHTLLSHTTSVRLDSYVYTVEGIRAARARLAPEGVLSLAFGVLSAELGRKIYLMMQRAFDGVAPVAVYTRYDGSVVFLQSKAGDLRLASRTIERLGMVDRTHLYADPTLRADVSTDDWPFFYMPQRVYPVSYVFVVLMLLALATLVYAAHVGGRPAKGGLPFFFLGAGFMLIETKGIAELGLTFGNTWQVIGIVIAAILAMAWLGNWLVARLRIQQPWAAYAWLGVSLLLGLAFARAGQLPATHLGRTATVIILTLPLLFSGVVFSTTLARARDSAGALGMNLLGAMAGGMLEYNSMYFGFQSLYWLGLLLYGLAFVASLRARTPRLSVV